MAQFIAYLSEGDDAELAKRVEEHYPKPAHHKLNDRLYFINYDGIAQTVADDLGFDGENQQTAGVVLKLNGAYAGFAPLAIWDWLDLDPARAS